MAEEQNNTQIEIQRLFVKDISFGIPEGSEIFQKQWQPHLDVSLHTDVNKLPEDDIYEVVLTVEANVKCEDTQAFHAEVQQAGIFKLANIPEDNMEHTQYAFCPGLLYPYAREAIADVVTKGGFPQLNLSPVNFDMLYQQRKNEQNTQTDD